MNERPQGSAGGGPEGVPQGHARLRQEGALRLEKLQELMAGRSCGRIWAQFAEPITLENLETADTLHIHFMTHFNPRSSGAIACHVMLASYSLRGRACTFLSESIFNPDGSLYSHTHEDVNLEVPGERISETLNFPEDKNQYDVALEFIDELLALVASASTVVTEAEPAPEPPYVRRSRGLAYGQTSL